MTSALRTHVLAERRRLGLAVFALAVLAYAVALGGAYVFDDLHSVSDNPALHDVANFWRWLSDPTAFSQSANSAMYRPALLVSFGLNLAVSPAAWSLKAGNVLLHALCAWLLFGWLVRLAVQRFAAFAAAALFAVHPLVSEAVNLVSARSELLCVFGLLLGLRAHLAWLRGTGLANVFGMVLGAAIACGSKETGVVLPVLLAVQAASLRRQRWDRAAVRRAVLALLPVVAVVIAYLVLRKILLGQATVQLLGRTGGDPLSGHGRSLAMQLATMGALLPEVLVQMVAPLRQSLDPAVTYRASFGDPLVLLGWASLAGLSLAAWSRGPSARVRRIGVAFAWAVAAPWIVVPLNVPLAEHRLYGPLVGLAMVMAPLLPRARRPDRSPRQLALCQLRRPAFVVLVLLGVVASARRSWLYRDERLLWRAELALHPQSFRAHWGLGASTWRMGDPAGAVPWLADAHAMYPGHFDALRHLVEALVAIPDEQARPFQALARAEELRERSPGDPWVRTLCAQADLQAGRVTGDRDYFTAAEREALGCLQMAPPKAYVYRLAAAARRGLGDLDGALAHLDASLARGLDHYPLRIDRAFVLRDLGRMADAQRALLRLQQELPFEPAVQVALQQLAAPPR